MEQKPDFDKLFSRFLNNQATQKELDLFFQDLNGLGEEKLKNHINAEMQMEEQSIAVSQPHLQNIFAKIEQQIDRKPKSKLLWTKTWYKVAAAAAVVLGLGYLMLYNDVKQVNIVPGSSKAVLIINNEEKALDNKTIRSFSPAAAISVTTAADGSIIYRQISNDTTGLSALHTVSTPVGGFYKVTLGDGTQVFLNAKSSIEFPVGFYGAERHVKVNGEAYFKVAKNKKMPFIVSVGGTDVKVLGTEFMINSFAKQTKTTLFEGSVQLSYLSKRQILVPGEEGISDPSGILVNQADTAATLAWTNGLFVFNDQPLINVLQELSRWYDFTFDAESIPNKRLYIRLNRNTAFKDVLQMLQTTTGLNFKIEERRLSIEN
ncbi:FecR family protein [Nubsella zeaxanthinifaciens]|uniref:FecR family protein n=1 Tax=Nubsella zeaxanthinifaciens TaxID=392412 RepID=UPI000DE55041|nr:FecR domain-containing protein [Nubsella zeaxanthinifaciens]